MKLEATNTSVGKVDYTALLMTDDKLGYLASLDYTQLQLRGHCKSKRAPKNVAGRSRIHPARNSCV